VISCSSDCTLKFWRVPSAETTSEESKCIKNAKGYHKDFIKSLAYAPQTEWIYSGGLDSNIFLWDIEQLKPLLSLSSPEHKTHSIYALSTTSNGNILVSGSTETILRVWDVRVSPQKAANKMMKLRGHSDNIRACVISEDHTKCISSSSDGTVKLWDLRQQRCIHTFDTHDESVWTLLVPDRNSFSHFYSAGKDKKVFWTSLSTLQSTLILEESHEINKVSKYI
jgi:WD repeat-containing protein 48